MAERRKSATKKLEKLSMNPKTPMSKQQKEVTDWLKANVPTKKTKFLHSHVVDYFCGNKAIDLLMSASPWAPVLTKGKVEIEEGQLVFDTREKCVEFMDTLLRYKMFHRAKKIPVEEKEKKGKKKDDKVEIKDDKVNTNDDEVDTKDDKVDTKDDKTDTDLDRGSETGEEEKVEKKEKKKRKIRLDMHLEQIFVDSSDAFVWLYDPIPWYYWVFGGGICLVIIMFCLFPLWPRAIRRGAHWMATAAVGFLIGVLILGILKYLIFAVLYLLSARKFRFWIMPNLTKDVGFMASFWPLYDYTYTGEVIEEVGDEDEKIVTENNDEKHTVVEHEESDSNESGKSGFEFVQKNKDE